MNADNKSPKKRIQERREAEVIQSKYIKEKILTAVESLMNSDHEHAEDLRECLQIPNKDDVENPYELFFYLTNSHFVMFSPSEAEWIMMLALPSQQTEYAAMFGQNASESGYVMMMAGTLCNTINAACGITPTTTEEAFQKTDN